METIQQASIYKFRKQNKYLIHSLSRLQMGASVASEPFIWRDGNVSLNEVAEEMRYALNESKTGLPNPINWKESAKEFLKNIGLKKQNDLYKDTILVSVLKKNNILSFISTKNQGSEGFTNIFKEKIEIAEYAGIEKIASALGEALNKSE